jgi:hypothetical protein
VYEAYEQVPWYVDLWRGLADLAHDWLQLFRGDGFEIAFGVVSGLLVLFIALLVIYGIFRAADQWFTPKEEGGGRVTKRRVIPGYWQYHYCFSSGKFEYGPVSVPGPPEWVPPRHMVEVMLIDGGATREFEVDQAAYGTAGMQRPVRITFQRGRLSGTQYINSYVSA